MHHPPRGGFRRRLCVASVVGGTTLLLTGCAAEVVDQWQRGGLPEGITEEAPIIEDMWVGFWITALAVVAVVWGLILWASFAYRRRHPELPSVVTILNDTGQRYFTTPLCGEAKHVDIPEREHPLDPYTVEQLDRYQKTWEVLA